MNSNDYIEKAKHALATGQPNLAMLYMRRGMGVLEQRRRERLQTTEEGRFLLMAEAVDHMVEAFKAMVPAVSQVGKAFDEFHINLLEAQYAMVSE